MSIVSDQTNTVPDQQLRKRREAIVDAHIAAETSAHDIEAALATFRHPRYEVPAFRTIADGPDPVRDLLGGLLEAFPDFWLQKLALHHSDDAVTVECKFGGTHRGTWAGVPATGKPMEVEAVCIFVFDGPDLVCEKVYFDHATVLSQLTATDEKGKTDETPDLKLIQDLYSAFRCGNIQAVLDLLDPHAELTFEGPEAIPWAGTWHGREGWAKFFSAIGANLNEVKLQMEPFAAQDGKVVAVGRYEAQVERTGKLIDSPLVHLWTIRGGLVTRCQELTNTAAEASSCEKA